jgi:cell division protein FtsL
MSPSAMTAAGRGAASGAKAARAADRKPARGANAKPARTASARATSAPGHRRQLRKPVAPARPRRVSGPAGGRARTRTVPTPAVVVPRVVGLVRSLPDRSLVDRLVRGRAWIPVLGVLLAGIVAMQVEVLKLGTSIGRSIEQSTTLQGQNEALQASVASLADSQRIEQLAANMGMIMPAPTAVSFLPASANGNVGSAIANIHAPDQSAFEAELPDESSSATGDSSSQADSSTTADGSDSTPGQAVTVPDAPAITATGSAPGDTGQGADGTPTSDGTTAAPTDATGAATEDVSPATGTDGAATGTDSAVADGAATGAAGTASAATGAAAPVAGPPQTGTGAEG